MMTPTATAYQDHALRERGGIGEVGKRPEIRDQKSAISDQRSEINESIVPSGGPGQGQMHFSDAPPFGSQSGGVGV